MRKRTYDDPRGPEFNLRSFGGIWHAPVLVGNMRKWVSLKTRNKSEAVRTVRETGVDRLYCLAKAEAITAQAVQLVTAKRDLRFSDAVDLWRKEIVFRLSKLSASSYEASIKAFIEVNSLWNSRLSEATREMCQEFINAPAVAYNTLCGYHNALRSFFGFCQDSGYMMGNPAKLAYIAVESMALDRLERNPRSPWTSGEFAQFMECGKIKPGWKIITGLGWHFGFRISDAMLMQWKSFEVRPDWIVLWQRKTRGRIAIPLKDPAIGTPGCLRMVEEIMKLPRGSEYILPAFANFYANTPTATSTEFARLLKVTGIKKTFHGLRHAFRDRMRSAGKPIEEIARLMGHRTLRITADYGDPFYESWIKNQPQSSEAPASAATQEPPESAEPDVPEIWID